MIYTLKQARRLADKTQVKMAELMGISRDSYRKIEAYPEKATVKQAYAISQITGIPIDKIFFTANSTLSGDEDGVNR